MPQHLQNISAVTATDGRIYVMSGCSTEFCVDTSGNSRTLSHVLRYTPATNSWTTLGKIPVYTDQLHPIVGGGAPLAAAAGNDGIIYTFGGCADHPFCNSAYQNAVEAYDVATDAWSARSPMPRASANPQAMTGSDGRIYVLGSFEHYGGPGTAVYAYTPATDTWTSVPPLPHDTSRIVASRGPDGRIYVMGADFGASRDSHWLAAYTPQAHTWQELAPPPSGRREMALAAGQNGRLYVIGGCDDAFPRDFGWSFIFSDHYQYCDNGLALVEVYTPKTNTWTTAGSLHTAREDLAAVTGQDGRIYALGGGSTTGLFDHNSNYWNTFNSVEAYTPGN